MMRRGEKLTDHILWTAKDVFLEMGFERTSMDLVASRAKTSKRSLYVHFESKEKLFLAVIEFVRDLFLGRLGFPDDMCCEGSDTPGLALARYCERYLQLMFYQPSVQMMRITMAESTRFPEASAQFFDVMFSEVEQRLRRHFETRYAVSPEASAAIVGKLLGRLLYPGLPRALFELDPPRLSLDPVSNTPGLDLSAVTEAIAAASTPEVVD